MHSEFQNTIWIKQKYEKKDEKKKIIINIDNMNIRQPNIQRSNDPTMERNQKCFRYSVVILKMELNSRSLIHN